MPAYCSKRPELFTISVFLGGSVSAVAFRTRADQISSYFDLPVLHRYSIAPLVLAYLLPTLIFYIGFYVLNGLLIRRFGAAKFNEQRKNDMKMLLDATLSGKSLMADPSDLLDERAWISLKKYWRPK
jgi:hypothetical protein